MPTSQGLALAGLGTLVAGLAGAVLFVLRAVLRELRASAPALPEAQGGYDARIPVELATLNSRVTLLEDRFGAHKEEMHEEVSRAKSAFASARQTLQRAREVAESVEAERNAAEDDGGDDGGGGEGGGVLPMRTGMVGAPPQDMSSDTERLRQMIAREAFAGGIR